LNIIVVSWSHPIQKIDMNKIQSTTSCLVTVFYLLLIVIDFGSVSAGFHETIRTANGNAGPSQSIDGASLLPQNFDRRYRALGTNVRPRRANEGYMYQDHLIGGSGAGYATVATPHLREQSYVQTQQVQQGENDSPIPYISSSGSSYSGSRSNESPNPGRSSRQETFQLPSHTSNTIPRFEGETNFYHIQSPPRSPEMGMDTEVARLSDNEEALISPNSRESDPIIKKFIPELAEYVTKFGSISQDFINISQELHRSNQNIAKKIEDLQQRIRNELESVESQHLQSATLFDEVKDIAAEYRANLQRMQNFFNFKVYQYDQTLGSIIPFKV
jgi:hypothetical protein